jgi:GTP cyclohydrolase I
MNAKVHQLNIQPLGNETVGMPLSASDKHNMAAAVAKKVEELFDVLRIDYRADHNTRDTPSRVAKMLVHETLSGRYNSLPAITEFENVARYDELIVVGPIDVRSTCAHHLMPIYGSAFIGVLPQKDGKIIGLSKYDRIVDHFAARLQIQEELVMQIANYIDEVSRPRGLAVRISAVHMCRTHRGVRAGHESRMVNSAFLGELRENVEMKSQFLLECQGLER